MSPGSDAAALQDPPWLRRLLIGVVVLFLVAFLAVPVVVVFREAFAGGWRAFFAALDDADSRSAIRLTLLVAAIVVPLNVVFGLAAGWALTRFRFRGKSVLVTLIDLPFSISPVVAGLLLVLLFGAQGWFTPLLGAIDVQVVFAVPGIVLATLFVTFPFVARELVAFMQEQSLDPELAAFTLGAGGWATFWHITLPSIRWSLLYGVLLCNARAMGEFGAVSVVSGHIRGLTNTMPLHVEVLYDQYDFAAAFAVASLLALLGLVTLVAKGWIEYVQERGRTAG
ncbi:sulfate ABC transporter permease subunit CysW [Coralloluteibacterium stylophorae]|uniref:Sulfate ABC transporter permease subunit CysW n=1 Tax=Coralloluteibacterium stylophorae TaxID=1776034 RepID=A0A8J7VSP4_9GAMM|nr:sulfate ABC transporter permease subunit CysW [Coralloluteibacterium stylophorae]MBS7456964.1 sulfate ABC transporter permease subunit CysW [Coralloluteibacterium stylophorae]